MNARHVVWVIHAHPRRPPAYQGAPELFGAGTLPRGRLHDPTQALGANQAALIVVGEATLEKRLDKAVTRAANVITRSLKTVADQLASALTEARKS